MIRKKKNRGVKFFLWGVVIFFFLFGVYILIKDFSHSLFLSKKERINVIFYGDFTYYFSLDREGEINYYLYFPADLKLTVPGGYGIYRVGGLRKLVSLEKKPEIFKKTFSLATSSFVDYYFFPKKTEIYYGFDKKNDLVLPSLAKLISYQSNANFFDRIYFFFFFLRTPLNNYLALPLVYDEKKVFKEKEFFKKTQGYFYKKIFHQEDLSIQIVYYQSYSTALSLSSIIEGEGIRVSDLAKKEKVSWKCLILENKGKNSITAVALKDFFHCQIKKKETDLYDIIFILNNEENNWVY